MRHEAKIFLAIVRDANSQDVDLNPVIPLLRKHLCITDVEMDEIIELLKADIRETNATYPAYGEVNAILQRMSPRNPRGE